MPRASECSLREPTQPVPSSNSAMKARVNSAASTSDSSVNRRYATSNRVVSPSHNTSRLRDAVVVLSRIKGDSESTRRFCRAGVSVVVPISARLDWVKMCGLLAPGMTHCPKTLLLSRVQLLDTWVLVCRELASPESDDFGRTPACLTDVVQRFQIVLSP